VLEPAERRLFVNGTVTPIAGRAFDLLLLLVERAGGLVTKDEIFDRVWAGLVVEENNIQVQISALRKLVGSETVQTVPGRGYRFVGAVEAVGVDEPRAAIRTNLPRPLTAFIGNRDHVDRCARLLHATRLLTVTGAGGLGKTRLSVETASACIDDYSDGVWFVDLAPITDPTLVSQAVALVVGVAEQATERLMEAIERFIMNRRVLLILDSCEHLLRGCAEVAFALLQGCAHLTILATSREPLHVRGESVYPLPALPVPDMAGSLTLDDVASYDAVRLFVERARSVQPEFRLTEDNLRAVCEICARVDGIPLALELAAARARVLSMEAIAKRLSDRFRLLKSSDTTAPSRQQALRATIDWSYDLLDAFEKRLFQRLAVFVGGWTLPAAAAVCSDGIDHAAVFDFHDQLVDKSLVAIDPRRDRYMFLDTCANTRWNGSKLRAKQARREPATSRSTRRSRRRRSPISSAPTKTRGLTDWKRSGRTCAPRTPGAARSMEARKRRCAWRMRRDAGCVVAGSIWGGRYWLGSWRAPRRRSGPMSSAEDFLPPLS
jgi:non-specific serine/threonine protein kinase